MSSLQDQLDAITARTRALVQPDRLAVSERAVQELFRSGIEDSILPAGAKCPTFSLVDGVTGRLVHSSDLLSLGPVVVKFFRGRWDPYCVTELELWRNLYPDLRARHALLVAISPQTRRQNDFTAQQHDLPFPVLSDPACALSAQFGLMHNIPMASRAYYRSILINIPFANANLSYDTATEESWNVPLPALYLVQQDGTITFAEAHADPRVRPEPADLLAQLGH